MSERKYEIGRVIGKGSFGSVHLARHRVDRSQFVVKKISLSRAPKSERESARREVRLLSLLKHPNIIGYKESWMDRTGTLNIVMEYASGGDLYGRIKKQASQRAGRHFSERKIVDWLVQLCLALQYIHQSKVLHRDLKTQNVFLTKNDVIKLGDFGIARNLEGTLEMANTQIGTPYYMSPEVVQSRPYDYKSDIWSLGCVLHEMCTLKHAFTANDLRALVFKILKNEAPPIPGIYSPDLQRLITACLDKDPENRPTIDEILSRPFVKHAMERFVSEAEEERKAPVASRSPSSAPAPAPAPAAAPAPAPAPAPVHRRVSSLAEQQRRRASRLAEEEEERRRKRDALEKLERERQARLAQYRRKTKAPSAARRPRAASSSSSSAVPSAAEREKLARQKAAEKVRRREASIRAREEKRRQAALRRKRVT